MLDRMSATNKDAEILTIHVGLDPIISHRTCALQTTECSRI
jgi:hypothetical protein